MLEQAMSVIWDGDHSKLESLFDLGVDERLLSQDELSKGNVNDSSSKLTKYEIAEQVLHDIDDLGKDNTENWLDEFPLFDEIQTSKPTEESELEQQQDIDKFDLILVQQQLSPTDGFVVSDLHKQPSEKPDLFSVSHENAATFILSNENILYIDNEPFGSFGSFIPSQQQCENSDYTTQESDSVSLQPSPEWNGSDVTNTRQEMAMVDEILKNTALKLDQWESDTSRSEVSSDGITSGNSSPKTRGEETDDPDWKPESPVSDVPKKRTRRSKPYCRGGSQEEKELRKKEQNKKAATRYRQKEREKVSNMLKEEESLKEKKAKLQETVTDIQNEIKFLKAIMRDFFKAKGIL